MTLKYYGRQPAFAAVIRLTTLANVTRRHRLSYAHAAKVLQGKAIPKPQLVDALREETGLPIEQLFTPDLVAAYRHKYEPRP